MTSFFALGPHVYIQYIPWFIPHSATKTPIWRLGLVCHSLVIWFQFYGFQLNQARLYILCFTSGFQKNTKLKIFVAGLLASCPWTLTAMRFLFFVLTGHSDCRVSLPFVCLNWRPDFACLPIKKTIICSVFKARCENPHFPTMWMIYGSAVCFDWMFDLNALLYGTYGSH